MSRYAVLYASCLCQAAGLFLLWRAGRFSLKKPEGAAGIADWTGSVIYGGGCLAMIGFAVQERHFLLLAGQIVCTALCVLGAVPRKSP